MKKFFYKTIALCIPLLILLVLVNYFGDAARLFGNDYEKRIAQILNDGHYVTNIGNYDERLLQKELISNSNIKSDIVILGSSRTMLINAELFPESSLYNSSVSGATIEDMISIYQLYKENKKLPLKIIIGIDPWTFNDNNGQNRWLSIEEYYYRFINSSKNGSLFNFKYKELFSLSYFQSSIKMLPNVIFGDINPQVTKEKHNKMFTKLSDGSLVYDELYRTASIEIINNRIASYVEGNLYSVENFDDFSENNWRLFEKLILDMQNNEIDIEFFLAPYAPLVYKRINNENKYAMVLRTENKLRNYAITNSLKLHGSFNPTELEMDERFFYDGMHSKESGIIKIINE